MRKFANEQDRLVHAAALAAPADRVIGDPRTCQFEARVDFASGGAIVSEDERGAVRVSYYGNARSLRAAWIDTVHSHADCCLYAVAAA
jgi:hypothetical protein